MTEERCLRLEAANIPTVDALVASGIPRESAEELHEFAARLRAKAVRCNTTEPAPE